MNTEMHFKAKDYWNNLSKDNRTKLLQEYNFWLGFSDYLYDYIPEDLKTVIVLKVDINDQFEVFGS
jgi:hypothetical protein